VTGSLHAACIDPSIAAASAEKRFEILYPHQENCMKRLALVAAVFAVAACAKNDQASKDSAAAAAAPAPAPAAAPAPDSNAMKMADSAHKADSIKAADSAKAASKTKTKTGTKGATKRP
jgi:hypothetical protein